MPTAPAKQPAKKPAAAPKRYWEGTGRRKTSVARVRITEGKGSEFAVNQNPLENHFQDAEDQRIVRQPFRALEKSFDVSVLVRGGGKHSQAEATRHGIARALVEYDPELRSQLKSLGFLKRDPRMRERQKFGLKRARRARQWRKR